MVTIAVAVDWIYGQSSDSKLCKKVVELLNKAGHTATYVGWGPNTIQQYARSHDCDVMVQVAGGKCFGTLGDFYYGSQVSHWYKAKAAGFMYYNCWSETWKCHREPRDTFSWGLDLSRWEGKTLPWTFNDMKNTLGKKMYYGYGNSAEELVKTFLANMGGSSGGDSTDKKTESAGSTILDLLQQVLTDIDPYGAELTLTGDTVNVRKTRWNDAVALNDSSTVNNSISYVDYDVGTPNTYRKTQDKSLIDMFGVIAVDESEINAPSGDDALILSLAQRGHNHSIELKCIMNPQHMEGKWVILSNKALGIDKKHYYISKSSMEEERIMSLTLEPGPPIRRVEIEEISDEEVSTDDEEVTDDDSGDDT